MSMMENEKPKKMPRAQHVKACINKRCLKAQTSPKGTDPNPEIEWHTHSAFFHRGCAMKFHFSFSESPSSKNPLEQCNSTRDWLEQMGYTSLGFALSTGHVKSGPVPSQTLLLCSSCEDLWPCMNEQCDEWQSNDPVADKSGFVPSYYMRDVRACVIWNLYAVWSATTASRWLWGEMPTAVARRLATIVSMWTDMRTLLIDMKACATNIQCCRTKHNCLDWMRAKRECRNIMCSSLLLLTLSV